MANETMKGNCLLINLKGHGDSEGDIFILGIYLLSSASKQNLLHTGASSQIINLVTFNSLAKSLPWCMLHVELAVAGTGMTNFECTVLPPDSKREAIPLEATINTMSPFDRIANANVFHMKLPETLFHSLTVGILKITMFDVSLSAIPTQEGIALSENWPAERDLVQRELH
ncbi:hypothetical protein HKD37_07G019280 [Glycine soja]